MLIQPNTNIIILKDCPLDKSYEHTIYFTSLDNQVDYFKSLRKHNLTKQSYQRYEKGVLHVQKTAESLYDCNYLMFQNESFGTKWFYAFITSVEYVNNASARITYEIDVMQTWFFDYDLCECFVEREHSATDTLFGNLVKENLDLGDEYVCNKTDTFDMNEMNVCVLSSVDPLTFKAGDGKVINGVYTPLVSGGYKVTETILNDTLLNIYSDDGQEESVVGVF